MNTLAESIFNLPFFEGLSRDEIVNIMARVKYRLRKKRKGEVIAYEGDEITGFVVVVEGTIHTKLIHEDGNQIIVDMFDAPFVPAPGYLYTENHLAPANIVAVTDCQLVYIDEQSFSEVLHANKKVMMNFIVILTKRIQYLCKRIREFSLLSLKERVLDYMLHNPEPIKDLEQLSRFFGVARPSLSRVVSTLKKEGFIERTMEGIELKKRLKR